MGDIVAAEAQKRTWRSFTREFKLSVYYNRITTTTKMYYKQQTSLKSKENKWGIRLLEKKRLARRKVKAKTYRVESPISPSRRRTSKQFCEKINLGQNIKRWGFCQKQSESCWKNIKLWLILTIQIVGLLGFVGETNYHFVERFTFLKRLHHNLNLQPRNFMWSCHENGNAGHLHCTTLQKKPETLVFCFRRWENIRRKGFWRSLV